MLTMNSSGCTTCSLLLVLLASCAAIQAQEVRELSPYPPLPAQLEDPVDSRPDAAPAGAAPPAFAAAGPAPTKISGSMVVGGDITDFRITSDGATVVFRADRLVNGIIELFSVPIDGGTVTKLNQDLPAFGDIWGFILTADGSHAVFQADPVADGKRELFSVPVGGGPVIRLNPEMPSTRDVIFWGALGDRAIFAADIDSEDVFEIYSASVDGSSFTKLNGALPPGGNTAGFLPVGDSVLFIADQDTLGLNELYVAPAVGGSVTKLNGTLAPGASGVTTTVSANATNALYVADQDTPGVLEAYAVPTAGGVSTKLNSALVAGGNVDFISANPIAPIYRADQETDELFELYAGSWSAGPTIKLNAPLVGGGDVLTVKASQLLGRVVYLADQDADGVDELYSVPFSGGAVTKLNGSLTPNGDVINDYLFSPNTRSDRVLYRADQIVNGTPELFSVPVDGGTADKLNIPVTSGVTSFNRTLNGTVIYLGDKAGLDVDEVFGQTLIGSLASSALNGPLPVGGAVSRFRVTDRHLVYRADQDTNDRAELYSLTFSGDGDADGFIDADDCLVFDPDVWEFPGEVSGLMLAQLEGVTTLTFDPVSNPGAAPGAFTYEVVRSTEADDFITSPQCVESDDTDTMATDSTTPPSGTLFHYVVQARNLCGVGSAGVSSTAEPRASGGCP
ncbi:MAG: hypothetical protein GY716_23050 [bacterium]|nr:hypothetical protein [bacterium]